MYIFSLHIYIYIWMHVFDCPPTRQPLSLQCAVQAWASREGDLHRGLMQYAIRRSNRNPTSRTEFSSMMDYERRGKEI